MKKTRKSKARHSPSGGTRQTSQAKHVLQVPLIQQHKQHLLQGDRSTDGRPRSPRKKLNRGTASASRDRFLRHKAASLPSLLLLLLPLLLSNLPSSLVVSYPLFRHCHPSSAVSLIFAPSPHFNSSCHLPTSSCSTAGTSASNCRSNLHVSKLADAALFAHTTACLYIDVCPPCRGKLTVSASRSRIQKYVSSWSACLPEAKAILHRLVSDVGPRHHKGAVPVEPASSTRFILSITSCSVATTGFSMTPLTTHSPALPPVAVYPGPDLQRRQLPAQRRAPSHRRLFRLQQCRG